MALLAGCGGDDDQEYAECTEKQKRQFRGAILVADGGVSRNRCKDLHIATDLEIADHVKRVETSNRDRDNNSLCQMTNHKGSDWLCIHTAY